MKGLTAVASSATPTSPECHARQLTATARDVPAGAGTDVIRIHFKVHGAACRLTGRRPRLTGVGSNGDHVAVATTVFSASDKKAYQRGRQRADLSRTRNGEVAIAASETCPASQHDLSRYVYTALIVRLPHGSVRARVIPGVEPNDTTIALPCKVKESDYTAVTAAH